MRKRCSSRPFAAFLFVLVCVGLAGCSASLSLRRSLDAIPAKNLGSYHFEPALPLAQRVQKAPDFLMSYLRNMDKRPDYAPYMPSAEERVTLEGCLALLPASYVQTLRDRLLGIFFVENWTGSGMADYVLSSRDDVYTILIINPETMRHSLSEWVTYRERTCFRTDGPGDSGVTVSVDCGTEYTGLLYLLLHESSHIMDYVHHYTPYAEAAMKELGLAVAETEFVRGIWSGYASPAKDADFALRDKIAFYGLGKGPRIHATQAEALYGDLMRSPFVSLYGSQSWAEDFAELCTWHTVTERLHQPYRIVISRDGPTVLEPMKSSRVVQRLDAIRALCD